MPVVGIVGGGQLARMTAQAAVSLAVEVRVLAAPGEESAAPWVTARGATGTLGEDGFLDGVDVLTFDHELVDPARVEAAELRGVVVRPGSATLRFADKAHQRERLAAAGIPVPPFAVLQSAAGAGALAAAHGGWPVVLKAARGGYDGRGVAVVADEAAAAAFAGSRTVVVEPLLPLERELAVLVARRPGGEAVVYPPVQTLQVDGICHELVAPAPVGADLADAAAALALRVADLCGAVGILAVELFVVDGRLLVNEVAPRPHNSGHHTIEHAATSQFENHLRAVLDWPLGATTPRTPAAAMVNVLGNGDVDPRDRLPAALARGPASVHLYAKGPRAGRKLGHVTALGDDPAEVRGRARRVAAALSGAA